MKIYTGLQNGAVLQRNENDQCSILLTGQWKGNVVSSIGTLLPIDASTYSLTGIPVGGPYTITLCDDDDSCTFTNIYVGDVWLLAGQSNMEGAGRMREVDHLYLRSPELAVRALYMDNRWDYAEPRLHQLWLSKDPAHVQTCLVNQQNQASSPNQVLEDPAKNQIRGVGPGFFFAKALYEKTGAPQGVIPCAVGGAPITMWTPPTDGTENYYTAALRRLTLCGKNIRGIFWYQGEGYGGDLADYCQRFSAMRDGFAACCNKALLPTVQVQIFRCYLPGYRSSEAIYSRFRQFQWDMAHTQPALVTVASNDLDLDDLIHLSADAQEKLGCRAADAMLHLTANIGCSEPEIASITAEEDICVADWTLLHIRYRNLRGDLHSVGFASGFTLSEGDALPSKEGIQHIHVQGNEVQIRCEFSIEQLRQKNLWYGFGHDFYCNISDASNHAIPALGPIPLGEHI